MTTPHLYERMRDDCGQSLSIPLLDRWTQVKQAPFYTNAIAVFVLDIKWLVAKNRLMLNDGMLADAIAGLDGNLPHQDLIVQCVAQSRNLRQKIGKVR